MSMSESMCFRFNYIINSFYVSSNYGCVPMVNKACYGCYGSDGGVSKPTVSAPRHPHRAATSVESASPIRLLNEARQMVTAGQLSSPIL